MKNTFDFGSLAEAWGAPLVMRRDIGRFSGGALHPRTMANRDALGTGIPGRIVIGGKVGYPVAAVVKYLEDLAERRREGGVDHV